MSPRDWVIVVVLTAIAIFCLVKANAQQVFLEGNKSAVVESRGGFKADSALWVPSRDVVFNYFDSVMRLGSRAGDSTLWLHAYKTWVQILTATSGGYVYSITAGSGLSATPNPITSSGTIYLPNIGTAGTYGSATAIPQITTDAYGRVTLVTTLTPTPALPSLSDGYFWVGNSSNVATAVQMGGDGSLSNTGVFTLTTTAVSPGSYGDATHIAGFTVDSKGRITFATSYAIGGGTVTSVALTAPSVFSVSGSPITSSGTLGLAFNGGQTANQFLGSPDGSTGAVSLRSIALTDLPSTTAGYIWMGGNSGVNTRQPFTGDISSVSATGVVTFTTTGVTAATYGDASHYPAVTVDAKGRVTAVSTYSVSGGSSTCSVTVSSVTPSSSITIDGSAGVAAPCIQTYYVSLNSASTAVTITNISEGQLIEVLVYTNAQAAAVTTSAGTAYKVPGHYGGVIPVTQATGSYDIWTITKINGTVIVHVALDGT